MALVITLLALLLDHRYGEPDRYHPLVGFGRYVRWLEEHWHSASAGVDAQRWRGVLAVLLALLPILLPALLLQWLAAAFWPLGVLLSAVVLYVAVGWCSLLEHARRIAVPLAEGELVRARQQLAMIVSRDTAGLSEREVASAATESVLENGNDAIFAALFWFLLAGIPGVVLYRLSNTLDAMWGYKNERYWSFGWAAARLDDLLNYLPARLTALSYAIAGAFEPALRCWREQGHTWKSPNAGPVMAAGAGALQVELGGAAPYHGQWQARPVLGCGEPAGVDSIEQACGLINRALGVWLLCIGLWSLLL